MKSFFPWYMASAAAVIPAWFFLPEELWLAGVLCSLIAAGLYLDSDGRHAPGPDGGAA